MSDKGAGWQSHHAVRCGGGKFLGPGHRNGAAAKRRQELHGAARRCTANTSRSPWTTANVHLPPHTATRTLTRRLFLCSPQLGLKSALRFPCMIRSLWAHLFGYRLATSLSIQPKNPSSTLALFFLPTSSPLPAAQARHAQVRGAAATSVLVCGDVRLYFRLSMHMVSTAERPQHTKNKSKLKSSLSASASGSASVATRHTRGAPASASRVAAVHATARTP